MKLFHVVHGDDRIGDRFGVVFRKFDDGDFDLLLIFPITRATVVSDFHRRVILNAKRAGWVGLQSWNGRIRLRRGIEMRDTPLRPIRQHMALFEAIP